MLRAGLIAIVILSAAAHADPEKSDDKAGGGALAEAFGNTILSTYTDGRTARLWLQPDGTYRAKGVKNEPSRGKWRVNGDKLCLHPSRYAALPVSYCTSLPPKGTTTTWSGKAFSGEPIAIRLVQGQSGMPA